MLDVVGKAANVNFFTVTTAEPLWSAISAHPVIVPVYGTCAKPLVPEVGVVPPPSIVIPAMPTNPLGVVETVAEPSEVHI